MPFRAERVSKTRNVGDAAWPLEHVSEERHNNNILVAKLRAFSSSLSDQRFQARSHNNPPAALDGASENCRAGKRGPCIACNLIDEKF